MGFNKSVTKKSSYQKLNNPGAPNINMPGHKKKGINNAAINLCSSMVKTKFKDSEKDEKQNSSLIAKIP